MTGDYLMNPLQQYFRQPKVFINLPSKGVYNKPASIEGDATNIPVFGMTGSDVIIAKTPDALLSGESTVRVIQSCCPAIKDAWDLSVLDTDLIFAAIKIATYGPALEVTHTCKKCSSTNDYSLDLTNVTNHYTKCKYDNTLEVNGLTIKTRPLTYKQLTEFNIKNFELQQQLSQVEQMDDKQAQQDIVNKLWKTLAESQHMLYVSSVESIETPETTVVEKEFINELLSNCDKSLTDAIKNKFEINKSNWAMPTFPVSCPDCSNEVNLSIELDQSNFFE